MFSVIIVYNDSNIQDSLTVCSLKTQSKEYELILVENIKNKNFKSASAALNYGAGKATGDLLMFVHQDVDLLDDQFLKKAEANIKRLDRCGIAGVAGMSESGNTHIEKQRNLIYQGMPKKVWGKKLHACEPVQTLDECLLIISKDVFEEAQFDVVTCDHWHLYGVDYCLSIANKGLFTYVLPMTIYHKSAGDSAKVKSSLFSGALSPDYFRSFEILRRKHKDKVDYIYTTCASFGTKYPIYFQRVFRAVQRYI